LHRLQLGLQLLSFYQDLLFHVPTKRPGATNFWGYKLNWIHKGDHRRGNPSKYCKNRPLSTNLWVWLMILGYLRSTSHYGSSGRFLLTLTSRFRWFRRYWAVGIHPSSKRPGLIRTLVKRLTVTNYELFQSCSI
jgi:hypothetical protein